MTTDFRALRVRLDAEGKASRGIEPMNTDDLPPGELLIRVHYSALNYKDGLSATGHRGVTRAYPHTPGVDASGVVAESSDSRFATGDEVIVTSYDLGMNTDGGFAEYIRVPADWALPLPAGMDLRQAMILGTAGFTAGLSLYKMQKMGQRPEMGAVLVTGSTGGVGSFGVALLAQNGYEVIAATGKLSAHDYLRKLGAGRFLSREDVRDDSVRPLLRPQWAGAIDTVGGTTLATVLKACDRNGNVAACGLVESPDLPTTVYPFILNGVNLLGVDSAEYPMELRSEVWKLLAGDWKLKVLEEIAIDVSLDELDSWIDKILKGGIMGKVVVDLR